MGTFKPIMRQGLKGLVLAGVSSLAFVGAGPAFAQSDDTGISRTDHEDIIVSARKRQESVLKTPVIMQVLTPEDIQKANITNIQSIGSAIPGVFIERAAALIGAVVYIRGVGTPGTGTFVDQSVGLNIDGFTSSMGAFYNQGMFDAAQLEVLKGPQSLFYGKSTSAGVISVTSADPGPDWDYSMTAGYEFKADEANLSGFVSGPISDNLGIRVAAFHDSSKGWMSDPHPDAPNKRVPNTENYGGRITLKYSNPDAGLTVKLKGSYSNSKINEGSQGVTYQTICNPATGLPPAHFQYDDCKLNGVGRGWATGYPYAPGDYSYTNSTTYGSAWGNKTVPLEFFGDGTPFTRSEAWLGIANVDYEVADGLTLTSLTGYGKVKSADAYLSASGIGSLSIGGDQTGKEWSQEFRLASDWKDRWINFALGGLYNRLTKNNVLPVINADPAIPAAFGRYQYTANEIGTKNTTWGVFGQLLLTPIEKLEIAVGARYTDAKFAWTKLIPINNRTNLTATNGTNAVTNVYDPTKAANVQNAYADPSELYIKENKWTPEVTLSYFPTDDVTVFTSYKQGYKGPTWNSPSTRTLFNTTTFGRNVRPPVHGEKVEGFEGGVKARLLDRQLTVNLTGYTYKYSDLQVTFFNALANTSNLLNAAASRVQGVELEMAFRPNAIEGLTLNGFLNYNDAHYLEFISPCWVTQTAAQGCVGGTQDVGGRTTSQAPKWIATASADYEWNVSESLKASVNGGLRHTSSYNMTPELMPIAVQKAYTLVDVGVQLKASNGLWDLSLQCRNCTNKYYGTNGFDNSTNPASATVKTGRNRQVVLQLTVRP